MRNHLVSVSIFILLVIAGCGEFQGPKSGESTAGTEVGGPTPSVAKVPTPLGRNDLTLGGASLATSPDQLRAQHFSYDARFGVFTAPGGALLPILYTSLDHSNVVAIVGEVKGLGSYSSRFPQVGLLPTEGDVRSAFGQPWRVRPPKGKPGDTSQDLFYLSLDQQTVLAFFVKGEVLPTVEVATIDFAKEHWFPELLGDTGIKPFDLADFAVAGVHPGMTESDLKPLLGAPNFTSQAGSFRRLTYGATELRFRVLVDSWGKVQCVALGPEEKTSRSIHQGSSRIDVQQAYGTPRVVDEPDDQSLNMLHLAYYDEKDGMGIVFVLRHGVVDGIHLGESRCIWSQ